MATETPNAMPSDGKFFLHVDGFQERLCNNLYAMWQTSQFCDLTLKFSGGDEIQTHSCLLAAFSPTIADILSKKDDCSHEKGEFSQKYTIDVKTFSARVIRIIVSTIYTGTVVASAENMEQLVDACRWLKMEVLTTLLEKALRERNSKTIEQSIKSGFSSNYSKLFSGSDDLSSPLSFDVQKDLQEESTGGNLKACAFSSETVSSNSAWSSSTQPVFPNESFSNLKTPPRESACSSEASLSRDCDLNPLQVLAKVSSFKSASTNSTDTFSSKPKSKDSADANEDSSAQENGNSLQEPSSKTFSTSNYVDKILSSIREMGNYFEEDDNNDNNMASTSSTSQKQHDNDKNGKEGRIGLSVDSSQENAPFTNSPLPTSKIGDSESEVSMSAASSSGQRQVGRKGNHPMKKSQKWVESFLSSLYSREKTFLEAVVPQIKTEVNDAESCPTESSSTFDPLGAMETREGDERDKRVENSEHVRMCETKPFLADADNTDNDLSVTFEADQVASAINRNKNERSCTDNATSALSTYATDRLSFIDFYNNQDFSATSTVSDSQGTSEKKCLKRRRTGQRKMPFYHVKKRKLQLPVIERTTSVDAEEPGNEVHEEEEEDECVESAPVDEVNLSISAGGDEDNTRILGHSKAHIKMEKKKVKPRRTTKRVLKTPKKKMKSTGTQVSLGDEKLKSKTKTATTATKAATTTTMKTKTKKEKVVKRKKKDKKIVMLLSTRVPTPKDAAGPTSSTLVNPSTDADDQAIKQAEIDILKRIENGETAKCIKCRLPFKDPETYREHITNHPIYPCPDCPAKFYLKHPMTRHRYSAHFDKSYLHCKECSFQAKTAKELCLHCGIEHGQPRPFNCEYAKCFYRADKYSDLQKHITEIHGTKMEYFCEKCGSGFTYKALYTQHVKRCLKKETHLCHRCGSVFHTKQDLNHHVAAVHFNIKKYKCPQCDHTFASHSNLKRHLYIHNNIFPFSCPHCDQKFRHSNTFKMHMESKHNRPHHSHAHGHAHSHAHTHTHTHTHTHPHPHTHHDNSSDSQVSHGTDGYMAAAKLNSLINPWATFDPRHTPNGHLYSMFF